MNTQNEGVASVVRKRSVYSADKPDCEMSGKWEIVGVTMATDAF